ncbi:MAG TPA: hypothetical protein GX404_07385 [Syntrophomonadaceae bacterium]|nr:hypothetical protein [Syntrophomonadaceae bacterium]
MKILRSRGGIYLLLLLMAINLAGCNQAEEAGDEAVIEQAPAFTLPELQKQENLSYPEDFADQKVILTFFSMG